MMMMNDKLSFVMSGCHITISDMAMYCQAGLPAGAGDVVLGGPSCLLGCIILIGGGGWLVCIVAAIGDVIWITVGNVAPDRHSFIW